VILTAQGTVETAVEAIRHGAYDYVAKPIDPQRLRILLDQIVERHSTLREVRALRIAAEEERFLEVRHGPHRVVGRKLRVDAADGVERKMRTLMLRSAGGKVSRFARNGI
jgi:DNA-binding NtrC family response regulator